MLPPANECSLSIESVWCFILNLYCISFYRVSVSLSLVRYTHSVILIAAQKLLQCRLVVCCPRVLSALSWLAVYKAFDSSCEHELRFANDTPREREREWENERMRQCAWEVSVCERRRRGCALQCTSLFCSFPLNDNINCYFTLLSCISIVSDGFRFIWFSITFN